VALPAAPRYHAAMAVLAKQRMTADEFLAWSQSQPGRHELVDGEIFAQAAERVVHAATKGAVYVALRDAVRKAGLPCRALPDGVAVRVNKSTVFEPDAQVYCGPEAPPDALLVEPVIVVEVLSPSTGKNDTLGKLVGYFQLPSIRHYLIVDPDERLVVHHQRGEGDALLTHIHRDGAVRLDPPGIEIALSEIYETGA